MKNNTPIPLSLPLVFLTSCVLCAAQDENAPPPPPPRHPLFEAIDLNHDGKLSAEEIAKASNSITHLDRNSDGEIDRAELRPPRPEGAHPGEAPPHPEGVPHPVGDPH